MGSACKGIDRHTASGLRKPTGESILWETNEPSLV
jgi:hypothetical protein